MVGLAAVTDLELLADTDGAGSAPAHELLDRGAPAQVDAAASRTVLVHGQDDDLVAVTHSTRLDGTGDVELVAGLGHSEMLDPTREHWPPVIEALHSMLS
jgi:hypothetical protein